MCGQVLDYTCAHWQGKQVADLGSALDGFRHLRLLDASKNALESAAAVRHLTSLLVANLQENKLTALPDVSHLQYLQILNANNNALTSLSGLASPSLIHVAVNGAVMTWPRACSGEACLGALLFCAVGVVTLSLGSCWLAKCSLRAHRTT